MPKATMNVSLDIDLIKVVRDRATESNKSVSAEFNDLLVQGLEYERATSAQKGAHGSA